jgi:hypothetical protein
MPDAKSTTKRTAKRDERYFDMAIETPADLRVPLPTTAGVPLNRADALHLREMLAHCEGFREGFKYAASILAFSAAARFLGGNEKSAAEMRSNAESLLGAVDLSVKAYYGESLDGVNFDACLDILIEEPKP